MNLLRELVRWLGTGAHWLGPDGVLHRLLQHLALTGVSVALAAVVALPLGCWLGHLGRGGTFAVNVSNIGRAVPTFAVLVLLAVGPLGIGNTATVVALSLFALAPMLTNTYVGVQDVDRDVREAARGMGLSGRQVLWRVELPLALPLVMAGVRIAAVQVVATATIAAYIGGGGLGRLIVDGLAEQDQGMLVSGALLVALLALAVEGLFALLQRRIDPARRVRAVRVATRRVPHPG